MAQVGKRVLDDVYVHLDAITHLADEVHREALVTALQSIPPRHEYFPNVGKYNVRTGALSLLCYPTFEEAAFPELAASWLFRGGAVPQLRLYNLSLNPPVLHRKELLVPPGHAQRRAWEALTTTAEALGLFDNASVIGFKLNWERELERKGFRLVESQFLPLGNELHGDGVPTESSGGTVARHLTALARTSLSAPVQLLMRHGLLSKTSTFFDYGCGRGGDIAGLKAEGIRANGWDPHYAPHERRETAEVVNLGFVVNVIEDPAERVEALHEAFALATCVLSVGVMLVGSESSGVSFNDGVLTSRRTFQKYFTQSELKDFLEEVLHQPAFMVAPGIAFVFSDKDAEQRFAAGRHRSNSVAERAMRSPRVTFACGKAQKAEVPARLSRSQRELDDSRHLLDQLWALALNLGRLPEVGDLEAAHPLTEALGGLTRGRRLLSLHYDLKVLEAAARMRRDDLIVHFVNELFSKRTPYRHLEPRIQRDVRAFFGDHATALNAARDTLAAASNPQKVLEACTQAAECGVGWLDGRHALQLHIAMVDRLPVVLRSYISCGMVLWDSTSEVQLVKIHIESGKLTLLEYDDFGKHPIPLLRRRIKVGLRRLSCEVFEYGAVQFPKPPLFHLSRYLHEDYPDYARQLSFDQSMERVGIQPNCESTREQVVQMLGERRLELVGWELVPARRLPDLDERCGKNFTYRSFVECGQTQLTSHALNRPQVAATYNALFALATEILDPVIDYFGGIRLTYGVCCPSLARLIPRRIAPSLDQHASHEVNRRNMRICQRDGAACDFIVDDEDMLGVAKWIAANVPFDRMYFYGSSRPLHVSFGPALSRAFFEMRLSSNGQLYPRRVDLNPEGGQAAS